MRLGDIEISFQLCEVLDLTSDTEDDVVQVSEIQRFQSRGVKRHVAGDREEKKRHKAEEELVEDSETDERSDSSHLSFDLIANPEITHSIDEFSTPTPVDATSGVSYLESEEI